MMLDVTATTLSGSTAAIRLHTVPDICPRCHRSVHPAHVVSALLETTKGCQSIFRCTSQKCEELFIAWYSNSGQPSGGRPLFELGKLAPLKHSAIEFPASVTEISPNFVSIYNQALFAEGQGLDQLVGIGIRKALEFLIKDYASHENPESEKQIREQLLGQTISTYVSDANVKECAKRAAWLGNDETHYTRKWTDRDVNDLKVLTKLTVNWIENALMTKKYLQEMSEGKA